ncbi:hypothetical protein Hanom_Chr04g00348471 [Helianthus anomalus]
MSFAFFKMDFLLSPIRLRAYNFTPYYSSCKFGSSLHRRDYCHYSYKDQLHSLFIMARVVEGMRVIEGNS